MNKYNCPKCDEESFSFWQKQFLGPIRRVHCRLCGASVGVPWIRSFAINAVGAPIVFVGGIAPAIILGKFGIGSMISGFVVGGLVAVVFVGWLQHRFVPLIVKDS